VTKYRFLATATVGIALVAMPATTLASGPDLEVQDRCDPATFNAAPIPQPACEHLAGDSGGLVTWAEFLARLEEKQAVGGWRFKGDKVTVKDGSLDIAMTRGGEAHTVTEVDDFGHGCVPELNALAFPGENPFDFPAACGDPLTFAPGFAVPGGNLIVPGTSFSYRDLSKRTHRFQCMIHPWMRTTVTVR
jgi:hypothetical protein